MADQITFNPLRAADGNGLIVPGAQARFFLSGTTTPATVYTDQSASVAHPTPLVADNRGIFPQVFSSQQLKVEIRNYSGALLPGFPIDPAPTSPPTAGAAAEISFAPTAEIPLTDVQAAIERVQANITTPTLTYGLGVTGSVGLLADIDATTVASGTYRIDATTVGTLPAGTVVANGGIVEWRRETAANASVTFRYGSSDRVATRDMNAGVWGAWRENLTAPQPLAAGDMVYHNGISLVRLLKGAAGQVCRQNDAITAPAWSDPVQTPAVQATTSGTAFDFTDIPAWARRIIVMGEQVSLSSTDYILVQLGTGAGFIATGYVGGRSIVVGGSPSSVPFTTGFGTGSAAAAEACTFRMTLSRMGTTNAWIADTTGAVITAGAGNGQVFGAGSITLAAALTQVRVTRTGASTFDAGSVSISYE